MEPKKTLKEVENAVVKRDGLAMTVRKVLEIFGVMNKVDDADVEFDSYLVCDDLILNKKCLEPHVDAFNLLNKQVPEYRKYLRAHETAKNKFADKPMEFKAERDKIEAQYIAAKEAEMDRLDKIDEELDKEVVLKGIRLIDRRNAAGEPSKIMPGELLLSKAINKYKDENPSFKYLNFKNGSYMHLDNCRLAQQ